MDLQTHELKDGRQLLIREAGCADGAAVVEYVEAISGESDFLTFGPGEFGLTVEEEERFLDECCSSDGRLYLLGLVDNTIVSTLAFRSGGRPRVRHAGEFGMSVRKTHWGLGIGSLMLDALLGWARAGRIVTKVNLRVRTDNKRAIALYKSRGFVMEGTIRREMLNDGQYYANHWMGLEL
jgi:RimJ/RimL family protein N-acetyltransferase